jgi:hypothetical protein
MTCPIVRDQSVGLPSPIIVQRNLNGYFYCTKVFMSISLRMRVLGFAEFFTNNPATSPFPEMRESTGTNAGVLSEKYPSSCQRHHEH